MKVAFVPAPWHRQPASGLLGEASEILIGAWAEATIAFYASTEAARVTGKSTPKGVQSFLNRELDSRFTRASWYSDGGRFGKDDTWLRVTFRHQMSLGSDFLDALRVARLGGAQHLAICAATAEFLTVISPNDAAVLISYEKLMAQIAQLDGVLDIPLHIGRLTPGSAPPPEVARSLVRPRKRDRYVPASE